MYLYKKNEIKKNILETVAYNIITPIFMWDVSVLNLVIMNNFKKTAFRAGDGYKRCKIRAILKQ